MKLGQVVTAFALVLLARAQGATASPGTLDANKDCVTTDQMMDYHRDPIIRWGCFEDFKKGDSPGYQGTITYSCEGINESSFWGRTHFKCEMDHANFDAHYKEEAKKPRALDRDKRTPLQYCSNILDIMRGANAGSPGIFGYTGQTARRSEKVEKDFVSKVKVFRCVYDEKRALDVTLQNGTLTYYLNSTTPTEGGWLENKIRKLFPEYEKWYAEYN
jgi:hypothetical protein